MKQLFLDIEARKNQYLPEILFFNMYNGQDSMPNSEGEYAFNFPALFVEFEPTQWRTMQTNKQDSIVSLNLHLMHLKLNDLDGYMERNLEVLDLRAKVNSAFHKWQPSNSAVWVRTQEQYDHSHSNVYHLIINYQFNYNEVIEPIIPIQRVTPPISLGLNITKDIVLNRPILITEDFKTLLNEDDKSILNG